MESLFRLASYAQTGCVDRESGFLPGYFTLQHLKEESGCAEMKCIALLYSVSDSVLLRSYDEQINIYDSPDEIKHKLERLNAEVLPG